MTYISAGEPDPNVVLDEDERHCWGSETMDSGHTGAIFYKMRDGAMQRVSCGTRSVDSGPRYPDCVYLGIGRYASGSTALKTFP